MKTFRKIAVIFVCLVMLSGCAWTDKMLLMARAGKAFSSVQTMILDVDIKMEGNLSQKIIQIPFVIDALGTVEIHKEPRSFNSQLKVSGGNDLLQIPFDLNQQWKQTEQGWQKYDFIKKEWVSCEEPSFNRIFDLDHKVLIGLLNQGEISWIKNESGDKQAVISFILQADQINEFLMNSGADPDLISMLRGLDEYKLDICMDLKTGVMKELNLRSLSTVPVDKTSGFEAVLEQFTLHITENEWIY